ncbi:MAG: hypothetical protein MK008_09280 [Bdellovibrionales bacterium]|nr:hypothetical protein [Bdellovibrionales bacterium]
MFNLIFVLLLSLSSFAQQQETTQTFNLNQMSVEEIKELQASENINEIQKQKIDTYLQVRELQDRIGVTPETLEKFQSFVDKWVHPYKDKIMAVVSDKEVSEALKQILDTGKFKLYIILQILLIFFMIFLRAKESSKVKGVKSWLWLNLWTFIVFMTIALIVIPLISFGTAYKDFIWAVIEALKAY